MTGRGWLRLSLVVLLPVVGVWASGCAPPLKATISDVAQDPTRFRNKEVEVRGSVVRNVVQGDMYATWSLTLASNGEEIVCHEEGWNTGVIRQAWDLAERARERGEEVSVTGRVRMRYREMVHGERVDLRSIAYKSQLLQTDYGDFPPLGWAARRPHPFILSPRFWPFYYGPYSPYDWYFPLHHPYYWHRAT